MLIVSEDLKKVYPGAKLGILIIKDVKNLPTDSEFIKTKSLTKNQIIEQHKEFNRKEFVKSEPMCFYKDYYKKFKKTYPVLLELESVVLKSMPIPNVSTLVEAMFLAELKNMLLTAGHDLDELHLPIKLNLAQGTESFTGISGKQQFLAKNDMMLSDGNDIISSILNGPDYRTRITMNTKNVMYYTYAPSGIDDNIILSHLNDIKNYVSIFSPDSKTDLIKIY